MEIIKVSSQTIARIYKIIYDFRIDGSAARPGKSSSTSSTVFAACVDGN